jgi:UDP-2,3-diacylglucosamine hydrolase
MGERHVFIADVHLKRDERAKRDALIRLLAELAGPGTHLYILGDLFDIWIGPRQLTDQPEMKPVIDAMKRFVDAGGELVFFHGNRDYYITDWLTEKCGAETVRENKTVDLGGRRAWLTHGDLLCTGDRVYHFVRWCIRNRLAVAVYLTLPASLRYGLATFYMGVSASKKGERRATRHGISPAAIKRIVRRGADLIICGHVHYPVDQVWREGGREARLIALAPWTDCGSALEFAAGEFSLRRIDFA